jgi:hypothetical protein
MWRVMRFWPERSSDLEEEKKFEEFFGIPLFFEVLMNLSDSSEFLRLPKRSSD